MVNVYLRGRKYFVPDSIRSAHFQLKELGGQPLRFLQAWEFGGPVRSGFVRFLFGLVRGSEKPHPFRKKREKDGAPSRLVPRLIPHPTSASYFAITSRSIEVFQLEEAGPCAGSTPDAGVTVSADTRADCGR
jgi:hypothetical protein